MRIVDNILAAQVFNLPENCRQLFLIDLFVSHMVCQTCYTTPLNDNTTALMSLVVTVVGLIYHYRKPPSITQTAHSYFVIMRFVPEKCFSLSSILFVFLTLWPNFIILSTAFWMLWNLLSVCTWMSFAHFPFHAKVMNTDKCEVILFHLGKCRAWL